MMRNTALGLAAVAIAAQTFKWYLSRNKKRQDEDCGHALQAESQADGAMAMSPFRKASLELQTSPESEQSREKRTPDNLDNGERGRQSTASPSGTEPHISPQPGREASDQPQPRPQPKALRFQDSEPTVLQDREAGDMHASQNVGASSSDSGGAEDVYRMTDGRGGPVDGAVHICTPDSAKGDASFLGSFSPKLAGVEAAKSPYEVSSGWPSQGHHEENSSSNGMHSHSTEPQSRHVKQPSFPEIDYEPEQSVFGAHQAEDFAMAPAPTEEGDAIARVEEVLADLEEQAKLTKRHSRSFSEPNLAAKVIKQHLHAAAQAKAQDHSSEEDDTFDNYKERDRQGGAHGGETEAQMSRQDADKAQSSSHFGSKRSRDETERPPLLRLEILSGPSSGREVTIDNASAQVSVGRFADNHIFIEDREVSGRHALLNWDSQRWTWQARDMGSMNGTRLNGNFISNAARRPGKHYGLSSDDILLLGSRTAIKIIYLPNAVLPDMPQNLKKLHAPPSGLRPTLTIKSEAMADLRAELNAEKSFEEASLRLHGAVVCRRGVEHRRKGGACEDVPFCSEAWSSQAALYGVFDGHIGRKSAANCTKLLPEELRRRMVGLKPWLDSGEGIGEAWEEVFLATDDALVEAGSTEDGTTATVLLVWKDSSGNICLQSANVGDSAALFCSTNSNPRTDSVKMTVDHRISDPGEKQRLAAMGIELGKNKTRLYGLNLSRCLGDHFIKTADWGFTALPSVSEVIKLGPQDSGLLIIASDGLWDVTEPGRAMQVAFEAQREPGSSPESIAEAVYQHAMKQRSRDDVCIIALCIGPQSDFKAQ